MSAPEGSTVVREGGEEDVPAVDGRVPGRRGRRTRDRLLAAAADLLASRSYRDVTVVAIAREVGTSPATFYQYFPSVEAAVQLLARRVAQEGARLAAPLDRDWRGRDAWDASTALVDAFLDFWRRNAAVLRVIDLAIAEGDPRFHDVRDDLLGPVGEQLVATIGRRRGVSAAEARAETATLIAMLARVAEHQADLGAWGADLDLVRLRLAEHVHWGVTGRRPRT